MITPEQIQNKIDLKTKPIGSLGKLETIAAQVCNIQQTLQPQINKPTILVFAGDHGITDEKVSPYPKDVTWQMVMNFVAGGAAINVFCRQNNISLEVVDAGVDFDFDPTSPVINAKIGKGTKNFAKEAAMTIEECEQALQKGRNLVKLRAEKGCNTIGFGEMGIGNTSAAAMLMHAFTNDPIEDCVGAGTGMYGESLQHKINVLKQAALQHKPQTALEKLATFGGFEIAMMTGAYLEAKAQNMLILVDGFIATSALLSAYQFDPHIKENCIFCHTSNEKGHALLLQCLNAKPIVNLDLRLGEGTGAAVAFPIIQSAVNFINEMASFEDAGVENQS